MIKVSTVKKGETLFENFGGEEVEVIALTDARRVEGRDDEAWEFLARLVQNGVEVGEKIHYLQTVGQEHYGPKLERERQYKYL